MFLTISLWATSPISQWLCVLSAHWLVYKDISVFLRDIPSIRKSRFWRYISLHEGIPVGAKHVFLFRVETSISANLDVICQICHMFFSFPFVIFVSTRFVIYFWNNLFVRIVWQNLYCSMIFIHPFKNNVWLSVIFFFRFWTFVKALSVQLCGMSTSLVDYRSSSSSSWETDRKTDLKKTSSE